jgi:hypothetical protein
MAKWADYVITAVRFNDKHTHIDRVRAQKDNGDSLEAAQEFTRQTVVKAISDDGITFVTAFKTNEGKWRKGEDVFIVHIHNIAYIKTKKDNTTRDNLDNLPEF